MNSVAQLRSAVRETRVVARPAPRLQDDPSASAVEDLKAGFAAASWIAPANTDADGGIALRWRGPARRSTAMGTPRLEPAGRDLGSTLGPRHEEDADVVSLTAAPGAPTVRVWAAHSGAGASTVALALADAAATRGVPTRLVDAAEPGWSATVAATDVELGARSGWRRGRRGALLVVDRVEQSVGSPHRLPLPAPCARVGLAIVDVGWSIRELRPVPIRRSPFASSEDGFGAAPEGGLSEGGGSDRAPAGRAGSAPVSARGARCWLLDLPVAVEVVVVRPSSQGLAGLDQISRDLAGISTGTSTGTGTGFEARPHTGGRALVLVLVGGVPKEFDPQSFLSTLRRGFDRVEVTRFPEVSLSHLPGLGPDRMPRALRRSAARLLDAVTADHLPPAERDPLRRPHRVSARAETTPTRSTT